MPLWYREEGNRENCWIRHRIMKSKLGILAAFDGRRAAIGLKDIAWVNI